MTPRPHGFYAAGTAGRPDDGGHDRRLARPQASMWRSAPATAPRRPIEQAHVNDALGDIVARDLATALPPTGILASSFLGDTATLQFCTSGNESHGTVQSGIRQMRACSNVRSRCSGGGYPGAAGDHESAGTR